MRLGPDLQTARLHESRSAWVRSFDLRDVKILVVCRGPVRQEAFEIFDAVGVREYGMLLSEKDSVVYPRCLAPELRNLRFPANVHRVPDYMGTGQEEKQERIREIVAIARQQHYTHIFAGYGFMAEDAEFIEAIEQAGLGFIGPSARVVRRAGAKDEAKKLARQLGNAVIPGVDNISARALLKRSGGDREGLLALARQHGLAVAWNDAATPEENAELLLQAGYAARLELVSIAELQEEAEGACKQIWSEHPSHRIRFKHIGGGGGKGQRVVEEPQEVAPAVMDVLAESKVIAPGSNRNFLIELNLERTRHNEIQLVGNGEWCVSLGGRDCSVQRHEQKLIEVSLTRELLEVEIERAEGAAAQVLRGDQGTLERMEVEGERFGAATGLDSVSTFECIVEGFDHFFMEMNTRIQVEHAVTELAYSLEFSNPDDTSECFRVDRLIEAMLLLAVHGPRLPRPERVPRAVSSLEIRINATNAALQPHAGGLIKGWSPPIDGELRFDQGIGARNPDTGAFVFYNLAGAYDSNIALVLTDGGTRQESYERMAEILRRMELRGDDLQTNLSLHYGMIQWFLGKGVMAEPGTRFLQSYLTAVGALQQVANEVDLDIAFRETLKREASEDGQQVLAAKETLLKRPIGKLLSDPHLMAGFLGRYDGELWRVTDGELHFAECPSQFLACLYHFINLEEQPGKPPSKQIWDHDQEVLDTARAFYAEVARRAGTAEWTQIQARLAGEMDPAISDGDEALWRACQASHRGFQVGMDLLLLIPRIGLRTGFLAMGIDAQLRPIVPEHFADPEETQRSLRALAPPPRASSDEIVTPMGGTFYAREAPHLPVLVEDGDHFEAGQPLFVIEVMKMFNKVSVPFSGTILASRMQGRDACVVAKGEVIFKIEPDECIQEESPETLEARVRETTLSLL